LKAKRVEQKRFKKEKQDDGTKKWVLDNVGHVQLAFQTEEENSEGDTYHARSFEDAFAHVNNEFLKDPENSFNSLTKTHFEKFKNGVYNPYQFAEMAMGKKPPFAIEILLNSTEDEDENQFSNWNIPAYIKEGLTWLKEN
jgi:hypothetical protein